MKYWAAVPGIHVVCDYHVGQGSSAVGHVERHGFRESGACTLQVVYWTIVGPW